MTPHDEAVTTTLGSCISACIRDKVSGIGGMNHFMLPSGGPDAAWSSGNTIASAATRYGIYAMEQLINQILRNGGKRQNLEVKIFGGGRIIPNMSDVGLRNIAFAREFLSDEGLKVVAEDVGDIFPRMVAYFPTSGRVKVKRLRSLHNNVIANQERCYVETIKETPVAGDLELF